MSSTEAGPVDPTQLVHRVAAAVTAHPGVAALHPGPFGTVATHLPGRIRLAGVRLVGGGATGDEPPTGVELAVVARTGRRLPDLAHELADRVRALLGPVAVDVRISDLADDPTDGDDAADRTADRSAAAATDTAVGAVAAPDAPHPIPPRPLA